LGGAEREFRRALQLSPNSIYVLEVYASYLRLRGRFDEALAANQRMLELDQLTWRFKLNRSMLYFLARRYQEGVRVLHSVLETNPVIQQYPDVYLHLSQIYAGWGKYVEAAQACDRVQELLRESDTPLVIGGCGWVFGLAGQQAKANRILAQVQAMSGKRWIDPYMVAAIYLGLGDYDRAMDWNEKAYVERSPLLLILKWGPGWDPLRGTPRFDSLLRRIGFPEN